MNKNLAIEKQARPDLVKYYGTKILFVADYDAVCTDCSGSSSPPWVTYLCVAFGILFLVMLIINVLLCSGLAINANFHVLLAVKNPSPASGAIHGQYLFPIVCVSLLIKV